MSRISLMDHEMEHGVSGVLDEVRAQLGFVPMLFRAYANNPTLLVELWERYQHTMLTGRLSRRLKEEIALMVAEDEHSDYGITLHSSALRQLGVDPHEILRVRTNPDHAHLEPREHALLEIARHGNLTPHDHGERYIDHARDAGAADADILEALAVASLASEISHVSTMLDIPADIRP
ncbi:carboxymuconolactone decarboxylase family protein [Microbulbifer bruguierae]|uniref:Carboxymuconolactone decarboxylase family protein n=1 Tax=Microbulbifer bruguierae TaxID=3029061 RepID=A0ABY8NCA3_9GAMM|nr:carboxymuconolactone decarboxylase family protein [Microbulbifer bruguierae]WGL16551.1 carboxymuconolactone decarboxylase family protein [Microbulbifer bruguierae]